MGGWLRPLVRTTCAVVRGCVFVSIGDCPVILLFIQSAAGIWLYPLLYRPAMAYSRSTTTSFPSSRFVFVTVGDGPVVLFLLQTAAAVSFPPLPRPALAYTRSTTRAFHHGSRHCMMSGVDLAFFVYLASGTWSDCSNRLGVIFLQFQLPTNIFRLLLCSALGAW